MFDRQFRNQQDGSAGKAEFTGEISFTSRRNGAVQDTTSTDAASTK
jgi:hypothetical protein